MDTTDKEAVKRSNLHEFFLELMACKRKWTPAERSKFNRISKFLRG